MRFLLDAMLPRRLARRLTALGRDAVHTLDLPLGNRTSDRDIRTLADRDGRVVVTKDADFVSSHVISGSPARLLLVSTGNTGNDELEVRLLAQLASIEECLIAPGFVELTRDGLVIHES
jgi:predicted nuclease of predicted toxin-antitoxin system